MMSDHKKQQHYDDLTQITGIGQSTQQWLRQTFDVYEYSDLAQLSAAELERKLKADGKIASRTRIEHWLTQAAELAAAKPAPKHTAEDEPQKAPLWQRVATFVVVFEQSAAQAGQYQTNVHHMEADVTHTWERIEKQELGEWIIEQLGTEISTLADASAEQPVIEPIQSAPQPIAFVQLPQAEVPQEQKLQHYIAKAQALSGQPVQAPPAKPQAAIQPPPVQLTPELRSSDKLQRYIAKAYALTEQAVAKHHVPQSVALPPAPKELNPEHKSYSGKLQVYTDKVNALAARRSG